MPTPPTHAQGTPTTHQPERIEVVDHVGFVVPDLAASRRFYEAALAPLGVAVLDEQADGCALGPPGADDFGLNHGTDPTTRPHVAFAAPRRAAVDAFCAAALAHGGRPKHHPGYYAAFVWDPGQNNTAAVFHDRDPSAT